MSDIEGYLDAIIDNVRRDDCRALVALMTRIAGPPWMMGSSIVGFGKYHYRYESGREGDSCLIGFAARKNEIVIYAHAGNDEIAPLVAKVGKLKLGKGCLYVKKIADIDMTALEELLTKTVSIRRERYGSA